MITVSSSEDIYVIRMYKRVLLLFSSICSLIKSICWSFRKNSLQKIIKCPEIFVKGDCKIHDTSRHTMITAKQKHTGPQE